MTTKGNMYAIGAVFLAVVLLASGLAVAKGNDGELETRASGPGDVYAVFFSIEEGLSADDIRSILNDTGADSIEANTHEKDGEAMADFVGIYNTGEYEAYPVMVHFMDSDGDGLYNLSSVVTRAEMGENVTDEAKANVDTLAGIIKEKAEELGNTVEETEPPAAGPGAHGGHPGMPGGHTPRDNMGGCNKDMRGRMSDSVIPRYGPRMNSEPAEA